jgi:hypothetical protein
LPLSSGIQGRYDTPAFGGLPPIVRREEGNTR